jgi:hypothetical protein
MDTTVKTIWAVGNKQGVSAKYAPYAIQESLGAGVNTSVGGIGNNITDYDDPTGDEQALATAAGDNGYPSATPGDPPTVTWPDAA